MEKYLKILYERDIDLSYSILHTFEQKLSKASFVKYFFMVI